VTAAGRKTRGAAPKEGSRPTGGAAGFGRGPALRIVKREFGRIAGNAGLRLELLVLPALLIFLMPLLYLEKTVVRVPVAVCDLDRGSVSAGLTRALSASRAVDVVLRPSSADRIGDAVKSGRVQGGLIIPEGLERNLKRGIPGRVVFVSNGANLVVCNTLYRESAAAVQTFAAAVRLKAFRSAGLGRGRALALAVPVRLETHSIFNPGTNYMNYMIPGLLPMLLQLIAIMTASQLLNAEEAEGGMRELSELSGGRALPVLAGKALPHLALHAANGLMLVGIAFPLYGIPASGPAGWNAAFLLLFLAAAFFTGLAVSALVRDPMTAAGVSVFVATPSFLFGGYIYPAAAMPGFHRVFAEFLPFTHYTTGVLKAYQMAAPARSLLPQAGVLALFTAAGAAVSAASLKRRLAGPFAPAAAGRRAA
jgi:ABC-2 type transport system permease protein